MIVGGSAAADILANNVSEMNFYADYSSGLIRLVQPADALIKKGSRFLWMMQDPVLQENLPVHLMGISNRHIHICNKAAVEV